MSRSRSAYRKFPNVSRFLEEKIFRRRKKLKISQAALAPDTILYMDYGAKEFSNHGKMERQFSRIGYALLKRHVLLNLRIVPEGTHCEASWEKQVPFFINTLMYDI